MGIKVGISTGVYWNYKGHDIKFAMKHMAEEIRPECIEIVCDYPFFRSWRGKNFKKERKKIRDLIGSYNLPTSIHAPWHDINLGSLNRDMLKMSINENKKAIETANFFGSEVVVIHPGTVASRKYPRDEIVKVTVNSLKNLAGHAEDNGVVIGLENRVDRHKLLGYKAMELIKIIKMVGSLKVKATLDLAHARTVGPTAPQRYVKELKEHLVHVHFSDNAGEDAHLPVGLGDIKFDEVVKNLKKIKYKGFMICEGWIPKNPDVFVKESYEAIKKLI